MEKGNFTQWDSKFIREYPFMAFGSLVKAYGEINHGKGVGLAKFREESLKLFEFSQKLTGLSLEKAKKIEEEKDEGSEVDIPVK